MKKRGKAEEGETLLEIAPRNFLKEPRGRGAPAAHRTSSSYLSTHASMSTHTPVSTDMVRGPCKPLLKGGFASPPLQLSNPNTGRHGRRFTIGCRPVWAMEWGAISELSPLKEVVHGLEFSKLIPKLNQTYKVQKIMKMSLKNLFWWKLLYTTIHREPT